MSGFAMFTSPAGWATTLFVEIRSFFLFAYVFFLSFYLMRFRNPCLEVDNLRCSTLT